MSAPQDIIRSDHANGPEIIQNINYRTLAASFASDLVYRRAFGPIRYMNKELLTADIALDLNEFIKTEGSRIVYGYLQTISHADKDSYLQQVVKPLQCAISDKLCILYNNYYGQDDGQFDITATENYKMIQRDLVDFTIDFINLAAQTAAEEY